MQETIYVGLDLGSSFCHQSVSKCDGSLGFSRVVRTSERHLRDAFAGINARPESTQSSFSASRNARPAIIKVSPAAVSIFFHNARRAGQTLCLTAPFIADLLGGGVG